MTRSNGLTDEVLSRMLRDGTSQSDRILAALDPDYVLLDERSSRDLLAFSREYAKGLQYYNDNNEAQGDWSAFLGEDIDEMLVRM